MGHMYRVKNWNQFQHYKDRSPPWIKLHRDLLDNYEYFKLPDRAGRYLPLIWLLASEDANNEGELPDLDALAFRLRLDHKDATEILNDLCKFGFLERDASAMLANGKHSAMLEKETEVEKETEIEVEEIPYREIIDYLNVEAGRKFRHTIEATRQKIRTRHREGFTLGDFKRVIDVKCKQWLNDPEMAGYLRPETLFGTKFEGYLNEATADQPAEEWTPSYRPATGEDIELR